MSVKLSEEDIPEISLVYDKLVDSIADICEDMKEDPRCGAIVVQVMANILCPLMKDLGIEKSEFLAYLEDIWDDMEKKKDSLLN